MEMICDSDCLEDFLLELDEVDYSHPAVVAKAAELFDSRQTKIEKIKIAFEFVRDEISHSWDIQSKIVTCKASDVLGHQQGICYAKSHLLAALLRSQGIPVGFCYQRLMLFDTPEKGYCIHALNVVFIEELNKWIRLDARGNKPGIEAEFSVEEERLAFKVNVQMDERDEPMIYSRPHPKTVSVLKEHEDSLEMYMYQLPQNL